jgi:hypothetical protein
MRHTLPPLRVPGGAGPRRCAAVGLPALLGLLGCASPPPPEHPWAREPDWYVVHPTIGHAHAPGARREVPVAEHPRGSIVMRTEARGFREDADVGPPTGPRILLIGDSHMDGVVDNADNAAQVIERLRGVEVVNAATGYWGPAAYGAAAAAWARPLGATACLVVLYEGNDLADALAAAEAGGARVARVRGHTDRLVAAWEVAGEAVSQLLNQDLLLAAAPDQADRALAATLTGLRAAQAGCAPAPLTVALLPTRLDVDPRAEADVARARPHLGLRPDELGAHRRLRPALRAALEADGIGVIDLLPALAPLGPAAFWTADWHLSVQGHAAVGAAVAAAGVGG